MSKVKELMEKRNDVLAKMTAIIDKAEEEVRAMTETEQQEYDKYKTELKGKQEITPKHRKRKPKKKKSGHLKSTAEVKHEH